MLEIEKIDNVLEALLFVSGDGLKVTDICDLLELQKSEVTSSVKRLQKKYGGKSGIHLISYNGKIQLASNPDYSDTLSCVLNPIKEKALSNPAMETLSIIAYRQPVTRLDIEHIRGVNCDYALQALLKNNLIEITGRKDALGKPLLFGTTETFLKRFGIEDVSELPDREGLLEKIRMIEESAPEPTEEELYNFAKQEENPDFLEGEDVELIGADEAASATDEE
ncbi:MAG: SMC-Scp complex subunit ScpB [Clostridiales bacterium]|uniref:SMC-Scp complex subunit ScpB n=1 Tax=Anaerocaecibacter muris TaxID=2941513 RepID=UPI00203E3923|nr:SMC-Scp complex subunit ScpB [Anaerocaecibacter muris]MDE6965631.1 SMC-Scp complex subunit ScpB [Clostridiales bacterium]